MTSHFKIGDKVAVLDDTLTGKVHTIQENSITIKTEDDFLMTFEPSDLVLIKGEQKEYSKYIDIQHEALLEKEQPERKRITTKSLKNRKQPPLEADLHIHQLTSSTKGMANYDILTLQLETAKKRLEFAIKKKIPRVVFIHGIGEGTLKKELEFLFAKYNVKVYPASFQKYGFGATEVYIYQNSN